MVGLIRFGLVAIFEGALAKLRGDNLWRQELSTPVEDTRVPKSPVKARAENHRSKPVASRDHRRSSHRHHRNQRKSHRRHRRHKRSAADRHEGVSGAKDSKMITSAITSK